MKIFSILVLAISVVGCSHLNENIPKQETRYDGRSEWLIGWRYEIEKKCHFESAILTVQMFEAKPNMTKEDVGRLNRWLLFSCYKYYNLAL